VLYDRRARSHTVLAERWRLSPSSWTFRDARTVLCTADVEGRSGLFSVGLQPSSRPRELARGGTYGRPRVAGGRVFVVESTLRRPNEVVSFSRATGRTGGR